MSFSFGIQARIANFLHAQFVQPFFPGKPPSLEAASSKNDSKAVSGHFHKIHPNNPLPQALPSLKRKREEPNNDTNQAAQKIRKVENSTPVSSLDRTYPPVSLFDTVIANKSGNAVSVHGQGLCFQDDEILDVRGRSLPSPSTPAWSPGKPMRINFQSPPKDGDLHENAPIFKTPSGKAVLQQQATRGCTAACVEMLKADHGKPIDWSHMRSTNLGNLETMKMSLEKSGLELVIAKQVPFDTLQQCVAKNGSAIIEVDAGCGGHVVILGKIDSEKKQAYIRDPYHGWAIVITLEALRKAVGPSTYTIQVKK